jgi:hypothetical protein
MPDLPDYTSTLWRASVTFLLLASAFAAAVAATAVILLPLIGRDLSGPYASRPAPEPALTHAQSTSDGRAKVGLVPARLKASGPETSTPITSGANP